MAASTRRFGSTLEQGFDVHAVYMRNWSKDLPGFHCPWADDLADAGAWPSLGIDLAVWDCEKEYKETVVDYLLIPMLTGILPTPMSCVTKPSSLVRLRRAFAEGADYIATGHYARLASGEKNACGSGASNTTGWPEQCAAAELSYMRAADEHKDQTYFLWRVPGEIFDRTIFRLAIFPQRLRCAPCVLIGVSALRISLIPMGSALSTGWAPYVLLDVFERKTGDIIEWESGKKLGEHDGAFVYHRAA